MLLDRQNNAVAICMEPREGFYVDSYDGNAFPTAGAYPRAFLHPSFYDES